MSIPTISNDIDSNTRSHNIRHSLQVKTNSSKVVPILRRHSSSGKDQSRNNITRPRIAAILEVEKSDDDENKEDNHNTLVMNAAENARISFTKKVRKVSSVNRSAKLSVPNIEKGVVNYGYDTSTRSSLHGSMSSLPVIREQYCCCQRWTRLEKILAAVVAILALVIICLVIAIGVVSNHEEREETDGKYYMSGILHF